MEIGRGDHPNVEPLVSIAEAGKPRSARLSSVTRSWITIFSSQIG